jgi:hypothetical protein
MALAADMIKIWEVIVVSVAVVKKAALLDQETPRIGRSRGSCVPTDRPDTGRSCILNVQEMKLEQGVI